MPRNGSGVWTQPSNTRAVAGTPIASDKYNTLIDDIAAELNAPRPQTAGGSGATSLGAATITPTGGAARTLADATAYVETDRTLTVGPAQEYATLPAAIAAIAHWRIGPLGRVILTLTAGQHDLTETLRLSHPWGARILVTGATPLTLAGLSLVSWTAAGVGNHSVVIGVTSVTGCIVGRYVSIRGVTGTGACGALAGLHRITAVDQGTNRLTLRLTTQRNTAPTLTVTGGVVHMLTTTVKTTGVTGAVILGRWGDGSGEASGWRNIAFIGDGGATETSGFVLDKDSSLNIIAPGGVADWGRFGVYGIANGTIDAFRCVASGCGSHGFTNIGGHLQFADGGATGNGGNGGVTTGGVMACSGASVSGNLRGLELSGGYCAASEVQAHFNDNEGVLVDGPGVLLAPSANIVANGVYGARGRRGGGGSLDGATISGHATQDVKADHSGGWSLVGAAYTTIDPPIDTVGNGAALNYAGSFGPSAHRVENLAVGVGGVTLSTVLRSPPTALNFATMAAGQVKRSTLTVTGVANNAEWAVLALGQNGTKIVGVSFEAFITGSDEVTVQAINHSAVEIIDVSRTFTVFCIRAV